MCYLLFFIHHNDSIIDDIFVSNKSNYELFIYKSKNLLNKNKTHIKPFYVDIQNQNYTYEALMNDNNIQFYEISLFFERYHILHIENNLQFLKELCDTLHTNFPKEDIENTVLLSGSTQMLYGIRYNKDFDIKLPNTVINGCSQLKTHLNPSIDIDCSEIDTSVEPYKTVLSSGFIYFKGIKIMDIINNIYLHYLHPSRDFSINSKLDVILSKHFLGDKIHFYIPFTITEIHPLDIQKMISQAKQKYKLDINHEFIQNILENDNQLNTSQNDKRIQPDFNNKYYKFYLQRKFISPIYLLSNKKYMNTIEKANFNLKTILKERNKIYQKVHSELHKNEMNKQIKKHFNNTSLNKK